MRQHHALAVAAAAAAFTTGVAVATDPVDPGIGPYSYSYFKTPVPLGLETGRIAVFTAPGPAVEGRDAEHGPRANPDLGSFGIAAAHVTPWAVAGWVMAEVPVEHRTDDGVRALLARVAAEGGPGSTSSLPCCATITAPSSSRRHCWWGSTTT